MEDKFPDLHALPYSRRDSVPWWPPQFISITAQNTDLYEFIVSSLTDNLNPGLAELLDHGRLGESIPRLFSGLPLPPLRGEWWTRIPGLWRYSRAPHDKVGAVRGALRLFGLNLYLNA